MLKLGQYRLWLLLVSLLPCFALADSKVLFLLPLTGPAASYGTELRNAVEFFADTAASHSIFADDKCDPKEAVNVWQEMSSRHSIVAVVGVPCSGVVLAIASLLADKNIPIISFGAMASSISNAPGKIYRAGIRDRKIGLTLGPAIVGKKLVALVEQTEFAESMFEGIKDKAQILEKLNYSSTEFDFATFALRIKKLKPQAILISSQSAVSLGMILKNLEALSIDTPIYTGVFAQSPILKDIAPIRSMRIEYAASPDRNRCGHARSVFEEFERRFGKLKSNDFTLISADVGIKLLEKLERGKFDRSQTIDSLCGPVSFDERGDMQGLDLELAVLEDLF